MNTVYTTFALFITLCFFANFSHAQQASQNTHQMFASKSGIIKLVLNAEVAPEDVVIRKTQGSRVVVETTIELTGANERLLQYLADNGRYELSHSFDVTDNAMVLSPKKNNNVIVIKGKECEEDLSYVIFVPSSIELVVVGETETSTAGLSMN